MELENIKNHQKEKHSTDTEEKNESSNQIESDSSLPESKPSIIPKSVRSVSNETYHAFSGLYAQIVIVVAAILVFTEVLHGPIPLLFFHGYLFTYLVGGGIICFIGIYVAMLADKCPTLMNRGHDGEKYGSPFTKNLSITDVSIYLRIGSLVFGLGALISTGLEVGSLFTMKKRCIDELNFAQPVLRGLFIFLQMHFLLMDVKEIIHYLGWFRHVALMHLVATNVALWIRLVLWESTKDWLLAEHKVINSSETWPPAEWNFTWHVLESDIKSLDLSKHKPVHKVHFTTNCWWRPVVKEETDTEDLIELQLCLQNSTIGDIWDKSMPILYPFIIQYCLVAAGVIYIIWSNLQARRPRIHTLASVYSDNPSQDKEINCASSTKGLFLGLLILVASIIVLILFFVLAEDNNFNVSFMVSVSRCGILSLSAIAAVLGLFQIQKMKSKTRRTRRLSELLQRIGMLAVYVYGICNIIVGGIQITNSQHLVLFGDGILMVIQACWQTLFIHQVSKKRLGPSNMNEKPGRQIVIFLAFCNMVLWILESFTTQHEKSSLLQKHFFGTIAWAVLARIFLPLVIFYRFHSGVALMEAWRKSYKVKQN